MLPRTTSIWQRDSQPNASGRPGAVQGFFDVETFERFKNDAYEAALGLGGNHLSFADFSECAVQHKDIISLAQGLFLNSPARAKRVAIVISGTLQAMQAKRVRVREGMEVFDDPTAARAWLATGEAIQI